MTLMSPRSPDMESLFQPKIMKHAFVQGKVTVANISININWFIEDITTPMAPYSPDIELPTSRSFVPKVTQIRNHIFAQGRCDKFKYKC